RLCERLLQQPGIISAWLIPQDGQGELALELAYDPRLITWNQVEREVQLAGARLRANRAAILLRVVGITSPRAEPTIERALAQLPGVAASVSHSAGTIRIEFDRRACALAEVAHRLDGLGIRIIRAEPISQEPADVSSLAPTAARMAGRSEYWKLAPAILGAALLAAGFLVHVLDGPTWLRMILLAGCYVSAGWKTAVDTWRTLRQFRFDIDVLMFAAAVGAAILGHYEEGGLLLVLFALGGAGEELALDKARSAIAALTKLAPETAVVRDASGSQREVRVEQLRIGDEVIVRPFDRVPADGTVSSGVSAIDQSPITGESAPVEKQVGDPVFAGTINGGGMLTVRVTKLAGESTLARIIRMVNEAQTTKSPTQLFTDRVERIYVPCVLVATAALALLPPLLGGDWGVWFYRSMAFLTAASPCALAIGTPAAVLSGIARAARLGVLVKGGAHLENLGRVKAVAFDKTGTLTRGRPRVTDVIVLNGMPEEEFLRLAAGAAQHTSHPNARAIVGEALSRGLVLPEALDAREVPAMGVQAVVEGRTIVAGKPAILPERCAGAEDLRATIDRLTRQGKTVTAVGIEGLPAGVIGLSDLPRESAGSAIRGLRNLGIRKTIMLTGDHAGVARAVAEEVGIDEYHAGLLPEDKVWRVRELSRRFGGVAMVGDGVNDAPAMAAATVGIAMGGAGTDVAMETADVALMADDLAKLPDAIGLSRFSRRIILQNLVIAMGVIAVLAPLAALGYAYLGVAVLFHEGSTILVVLNALRLLLYGRR
ncbi:MAG: heavy metal translocating P-type ATPase, partial [Phycisphaerae bacterium]|nr:heavy metal translocating P-type ATPase [Phycisphaerae bacterium]